MKSDLTHDVFHNPFKNRFNDPVTWRLDEMQAHSNAMRKVDQGETNFPASRSKANSTNFEQRSEPQHDGGMFASVFALVIVLLATVLVVFKG